MDHLRGSLAIRAALIFSVLAGFCEFAAAQWTAAPSFPDQTEGRLFAAGVNYGGSLLAIGGSPFDAVDPFDAAVHILESGTSSWVPGPRLEGPVVRQCAGVDSLGRIIVFSGVDGLDPEGDEGKAFRYDLIEGQQGGIAQPSSAMPQDNVACAVDAAGLIYGLGGGPGESADAGNPNSAHAERYDGATDTWTVLPGMPNAVAAAAAAYDGSGHILVIGGIDEAATMRTANVARYDIVSGTWSEAAVPDLPVALSNARAILGSDDRVYVMGGVAGPIESGVTQQSVYVLDVAANTWSAGPVMITPRHSFAAALSDDDYIYAMGGSNDSGGTYLSERLYTPPCPSVDASPADTHVWSGQAAVLTVTVSGGGPLTYQWRKDGLDLVDGPSAGGGEILGATTDTLIIWPTGAADAGSYDVRVFNPCGETYSVAAILTIGIPPSLGTNWTATNLHPGWALSSQAMSVSGDTQAGVCTINVPDYDGMGQATVWHETASSAVSLTPGGSVGSSCAATANGAQVGWWWWPYQCYVSGQWLTCYSRQACAWSGTIGSFVNLQVSGWEYSSASDTDGDVHVGTISTDDAVGNTFAHAVMWTGPTYSMHDLHPTGVSKSGASAVDDGHQYGFIHTPFPGPVVHAAMWSGTPESFVDLHPAGASMSYINGAGDGQQVGSATIGGVARPVLWSNNAEYVIELSPTGGSVHDAAGGLQVGAATISSAQHAVVWAGSAGSLFDLHLFLGPEFTSSTARGVEVAADGTITIVGYGFNSVTQRTEALMWRSNPNVTPGDANCDGLVDENDVAAIVAVLLGDDSDPCHVLASDVNADGTPDGQDVAAFVPLVLAP